MWLLRKFSAYFLVLWILSGCGYSLQHRLKETFTDSRGLFVPVFDNQTDEFGAEKIFTNALIRELESRQEVVLTSRRQGGLELHGTVQQINIGPTALTDPGFLNLKPYKRLPSEYGVSVTVALSLVDNSNGKVLWSKLFAGFRRVNGPNNRTVDTDSPSSIGIISQSYVESMYPEIARQMMRDVYDEMIELF